MEDLCIIYLLASIEYPLLPDYVLTYSTYRT